MASSAFSAKAVPRIEVERICDMTEASRGNATLRLWAGDRARVDGGRGIVEMLDTGR